MLLYQCGQFLIACNLCKKTIPSPHVTLKLDFATAMLQKQECLWLFSEKSDTEDY